MQPDEPTNEPDPNTTGDANAFAPEAPAAEGHVAEAPHGEVAVEAAASSEAPSTEVAAGAPKAEGDAPAPPKKKRRRRRKKKSGAAAAQPTAEGAAPAEGSPASTGEESDDDHEEGEGDAAESSEKPSAEGEAKPDGEAKAADRPGKKKRPKRDHGPQREKPPFGVGEEVVGKITKVMDEALMIDVSGKALGIFDRKEAPADEIFAEGERFIGKVVNDGARGGLVVLSRDPNRWQVSRKEVEDAFKEKTPVDGLITGVIKGGVEVDVKGLRGFAPASHVDLRLGADLHYLIGQRSPFEVVQFAKKGREFVLSRKGALEGVAKATREEAIKGLKIGEIVKGIVRSVTQFGAFVDVGGVDGLVHMTEASHIHAPLSEIFKVGEEIDVKILKVDEKGKVWLSKRAAEHDPWEGAAERYARGTRHKGKVVRLQPFGAFIELEPGIDGLLHVSDIASQKRLAHPNEVLKVGDELEIVVAQSDVGHRKIGLHPAPKEGEAPPPGEKPAPRLAPHQQVKCVVESQDLNGLQVRIVGQTGRHAKAFIPASATNTAKGTDLRKLFPVGKELDAKIIELDPKRGIKLSIKALQQDQERQSFKQYQNEVRQASKFGTFGDLLREKGITK